MEPNIFFSSKECYITASMGCSSGLCRLYVDVKQTPQCLYLSFLIYKDTYFIRF